MVAPNFYDEGINNLRIIYETKNSIFVDYYMRQGVNISLEGGSRSGKTFGISIALCKLIREQSGWVITIARDTRENLRNSAYATFRTVWVLMGLPQKHFNKNISDIAYNGNIIRFVGVNDDPDKALGAEQDILWGNEWITANKFVSDQMEQRTSHCCIFDYNPSEVKHWLYDLEKNKQWRFLKTTMLDNPYVPEKHRRKILSYEPTPENIELGTADAYMWNVYGLGKRAVGEATIFKNWKLYEADPADYDWLVYGGDFGFSNDPTALVQIIKQGHNLYLKELIYETGLLNGDIASKMVANGWNHEISCWDSADGGKSAIELRMLNVNAIAAKKPAGSVYWRIEKLKQFNIFVHSSSANLIEEMEQYKWATGKDGQYLRNSLKQLVPKQEHPPKDHAIDAVGYGIGVYIDITPSSNE